MRIFRLTFSALILSGACFVLEPLVQAAPVYAQDIEDGELQPAPPRPVAQPAPAGLQATDLQMRMGALENLVRALTGQVEKLQFQNNQLLQAQQKIAGDNDLRFKDIEQRLTTHESNMKGLVAAQQNLAQAQSTPAPATPAPAATSAPEQPAKTTDAPTAKTPAGGGTLGTISKSTEGKKEDGASPKGDDSTAQAQYDEAFNALRQAKYDEAEKAFAVFLKNHPKHKLTENAKYWLAETYYVRGKFQESAVAFAEAYQEFPKGTKAPDNLLKLSMSLGSMGKKQDACVTLSELAKKFPQAPAVTKNRAEQQKKTLGCS